jgi:phosphinothricin acetyltransferase
MRRVRTATIDDAEEMLDLYRPYVSETAISFEVEVPSLDEFRRRVSAGQGAFPWLAYEADSKIMGYAYAGAFRSRPAYSWSVESTVYVRRGAERQRIGSELYRLLLELLKDQGVANVMAGITLPNEASERLHERFGFVRVARFTDAGFKLDRWWDVGFWQLQLDRPHAPRPLLAPRIL